MKNTIFIKLFASFVLIVFLLIIFVLPLSFRTIRTHYLNTLELELENIAKTLSFKINPMVEKKEYQLLDMLVKKTGREIKTRITVIKLDGEVIADSEKKPSKMENHKNRPEIISAFKNGKGSSIRFSTTVEKEMLYVAILLKNKGRKIAVLRVSLFLKDINALLNRLRLKIFLIVLIVLFLSLVGAYFISVNFSKVIKTLSEQSRKIASGDFGSKVLLSRKDELGKLSESFNEMSKKLENLFSEVQKEKEKLKSIIASLNEGLAVINKKGIIYLYNKSFEKISNISRFKEPKDKFYWEVFRDLKINSIIEKAFNEKKSFSTEVDLFENIYLFSVTYISGKEEVILIVHDISEFKKLEKIKKDFVINVSHELRTPLTAIKGFLETLEDEIKDEQKHYIGIIKRNTERLINIVKDLLILSELEENSVKIDIEEIDLKELIENIFKIFFQRAKDKNLNLILKAEGKHSIKADRFKIEQLFINLIDNAIKYSQSGKVEVMLERKGDIEIIRVKDTGIGIPEKDLDRIFERFYVVDKSRSKRNGGTGLGLSIVKHIVLLHKGNIGVKSKKGEGTEFIIELPN